MSSRSSVDRAPARCSGGHGFDCCLCFTLGIRIKRLVPFDVTIFLYKTTCYHILYTVARYCWEYEKKLASKVLHYAMKLLLNLDSSASYDLCLAMVAMEMLEQRRIVQSLILFFK